MGPDGCGSRTGRSVHTVTLVDVGDVSEIPPRAIRGVDHEGRKFIVVNVEGAFFALEGICTHAYAELASGFLGADRVICPLHLSQFDARTGEALSPPAEIPLTTFPIEVRGTKVYIVLAERTP